MSPYHGEPSEREEAERLIARSKLLGLTPKLIKRLKRLINVVEYHGDLLRDDQTLATQLKKSKRVLIEAQKIMEVFPNAQS